MLFQGFKVSLYFINRNERIELYDYQTDEYFSIDWEGQFELEHFVPCLERLAKEAREHRIDTYKTEIGILE